MRASEVKHAEETSHRRRLAITSALTSAPMPLLHVPRELRAYCGGAESVELEGETISELINQLAERFPELKSRVLDASGALAAHLLVIHNDVVLRSGDAAETRVCAGDELRLMSAVAGG